MSNDEGDVSFKVNKAALEIDRQPEEGATVVKGTQVKAETKTTSPEGDEDFALLADGERVSMKVDRKESGEIEIRGRSGDGTFRLQMTPRGRDRDLQVKGELPEALGLMPLMWELYGDDSLRPPVQPMTLGTTAGLAAFWQEQIR